MNSKEYDELCLQRIVDQVTEQLRPHPVTTRNVVHAMFDLHYADWLGGDEITPTCDYESCEDRNSHPE